MGLFLSTYVNKVDKKGRVSIPASFRSTLADGRTNAPIDVVIYPSLKEQALDACPLAHLEKLSEALDGDNMSDEDRELIETAVFGRSVQLTLDPEGRIILPAHLLEYAGITENISFVGRRKIFQLWDPAAFEAHDKTTRERARANNISLSTILAKANSLAKGA
jgi:MraZ protein